MNSGSRDVAQIRHDNALLLFDEFVRATVKHPDAATLRGLEGRFAERLQIQPSYWSQIKSRSRQIGERLARQFESLSHKPMLWMDQPHGSVAWADAPARSGTAASRGTARLATQRVSVPLATDGSRANVRLGRRRRRRSALNGALTTRALRSG